MGISDRDDSPPFLVPFVSAFLFGIPVSVLWYLVATNGNLLATVITIALGGACGLGARIAARGWNTFFAACTATLIHIVFNISLVVVHVKAGQEVLQYLPTVLDLFFKGDWTEFANDCAAVAGRTFKGYPFGLYAAYRVADDS